MFTFLGYFALLKVHSKFMTDSKETLKNTLIGATCVGIGTLGFATANAIVKLSGLKEAQLLYGRFGLQIMIAITWWIYKKPLTVTNWYGDEPFIKNIWLRGIFYSIHVIFAYYSFIRLPVGDALCILSLSGAFTAILARMFLGELLPNSVIIILALGLCGSFCI